MISSELTGQSLEKKGRKIFLNCQVETVEKIRNPLCILQTH